MVVDDTQHDEVSEEEEGITSPESNVKPDVLNKGTNIILITGYEDLEDVEVEVPTKKGPSTRIQKYHSIENVIGISMKTSSPNPKKLLLTCVLSPKLNPKMSKKS